jgi:hypothetical protein
MSYESEIVEAFGLIAPADVSTAVQSERRLHEFLIARRQMHGVFSHQSMEMWK